MKDFNETPEEKDNRSAACTSQAMSHADCQQFGKTVDRKGTIVKYWYRIQNDSPQVQTEEVQSHLVWKEEKKL